MGSDECELCGSTTDVEWTCPHCVVIRIRQLKEAVKVLAEYAETRMRKTEFLADRDIAERDRKDAARAINANPIAAAAVREAGNG